MSTHAPQTLLLQSTHLGLVKNHDPRASLVRINAKNTLKAGRLYLRATLDEMIKIRALSKSLPAPVNNHRDLLRQTKAGYDR